MKAPQIGMAVAAIAGVLSFAVTSQAQGLVVDSTGAVTIEENGTAATVLTLTRPASHAQLNLLTSANSWIIRAHGSGGKLRLDEANTAGISFDLTPAGALDLGAGITANGNSTVNGNLTVTGTFSNPSSRTLKTDIEPIDGREMLHRVAALPIYSWRYIADLSGPQQIGPMAEDFRDKIGVGDGYYMTGNTAAGVSLAAIRGLNDIVEENAKELAKLRAHNDELVERLAALEARLASAK